MAGELGISRDACADLHLSYLRQVASIAWLDCVLTPDEAYDLRALAKLLAVDETIVEAMMLAPEPAVDTTSPKGEVPITFRLDVGDRIVLTGEMARAREGWFAYLISRGYVPVNCVSKKVKLVVAADPDSLSGNARKARDYGITIVNEQGLVRLLADVGQRPNIPGI